MKERISKRMKSKKGFIFTLLALLVIAFMIVEVSIYFSTYQIREESAPIKLRTRVVEEFATQLTQQNVEKVSYVSAYNAIHSLTLDSVARPIAPGNISNVTGVIFWNGTRPDTLDAAGRPRQLTQNGTLEQWKNNFETLSNQVGIQLDMECTNFSVNQSDAWNVQFNYSFRYELTDELTKTRISDSYNVSVNVPITGFEDPLLRNMTVSLDPEGRGYVRNIFPYAFARPVKLFDTNSDTNGKGWFYGDIFKGRSLTAYDELNENDFTQDNKKRILYTSNFNLVSDYGNMFGAVIYSGDRWADVYNVISVPFIATLSQPTIPIGTVLIKSGSDSNYITGNFTIYDIEGVRNFVSCGYYTTNPDAPSFFDRLAQGRPDVRVLPSEFGIETSIVGQNTTLAQGWVLPNKASTDHNYYNTTFVAGDKVMGLTGCKFLEVCSDPVLPKFRASAAHVTYYGISELVCSGNNAGRCG